MEMTSDIAINLSKQLLWQAIVISSPVICVALITGLLISILQTVTQIQDSIISTAPKILVVLIMLIACGGWMLHSMTDFARQMILQIPQVLR